MKKVLIVSYYFPPSGGPGVQRVLKFAKYLPEFGWEPVILTVRDGDYPARDESLMKEIPSELKVYRTKIWEPYYLYRKLTRKKSDTAVDVNNIPKRGERKGFLESIASLIRSTLFIPDARIGWFPFAVREANSIIEKEKIDVLYSSSPPYTTAVICRKLHNELRIPWIMGLRDPWTGFLSTPERWSVPQKIDRYLEKGCYESATKVEVAWRGIRMDLEKKYPEIAAEKISHLPNGFDSADFPTAPDVKSEKFTVTYTGSMYGVRNPRAFLDAIIPLIATGAIDPSKVRLRFVGRFGAEIIEMLRHPVVAPCVEVLSYLPHHESVRTLLSSDLLLLIVDEYQGGAEIVPGKVFEYIGARRPILAIAPEGAVGELIRSTNSGRVAAHRDVSEISSAFLEFYNDFFYGHTPFTPNEQMISRFERHEVTRQLAHLFDEVS